MSGKIWHLKRGRYLLCWMFRYSILLKLFLVHTCKDFLMRSKCILPLMNYWKPIFRIEKKCFFFTYQNFFLNQYIYYLSPLLFSRMKNIWSKVFPKLYSQKCKHTHGMFTFPFQISTTVYLSNTRLLQVHKKGGRSSSDFAKKSAPLWMFGGAIFLKWFSPLS